MIHQCQWCGAWSSDIENIFRPVTGESILVCSLCILTLTLWKEEFIKIQKRIEFDRDDLEGGEDTDE